jgi:cell division topological specificity factor
LNYRICQHKRWRNGEGRVMGFLDQLFGRKRDTSGNVAKERLLTVLVTDRVKLTPAMMEAMRNEIVAVIERYVDVADRAAIDVSLLRGEQGDHLKADIPLRRSNQ